MHLQLDQIIASTIRTTWLVARSRAGISLPGDRNYACGAGDRDWLYGEGTLETDVLLLNNRLAFRYDSILDRVSTNVPRENASRQDQSQNHAFGHRISSALYVISATHAYRAGKNRSV